MKTSGPTTPKKSRDDRQWDGPQGPPLLPSDIEVIVEKHSDGYVAYPLGLNGSVVGPGDSYEAALADVKSAIAFHLESFSWPPT